MPSSGIIVSGVNIERHLKRVDHDIDPAIRDAVRHRAPDIVRAGQVAALTIRLRGGTGKRRSSTGLRRALANAIGVKYDNEKIVFMVQRAKMPNGQDAMVILSAERSWRHPVYGNTNAWVEQKGDLAWFSRAVRREADLAIPNDIVKALERISR